MYSTVSKQPNLSVAATAELQLMISKLLPARTTAVVHSLDKMIDTITRMPEVEPFIMDRISRALPVDELKAGIPLAQQFKQHDPVTKTQASKKDKVASSGSTLFQTTPKQPYIQKSQTVVEMIQQQIGQLQPQEKSQLYQWMKYQQASSLEV